MLTYLKQILDLSFYSMNKENLNIRPVKTKKDLLNFIVLPWKIYEGDNNWVPPMISEKKVLFEQ